MSPSQPHDDNDLALTLTMGGERRASSSQSSVHDDAALPPLERQPIPGFLRFMPPLIQQIAELGATFRMDQDGSVMVDGFYKNGPMKLVFEGDDLVAVDRRNRKTAIAHFDDLVQLNFRWWRVSNGKSTYVMPERPWLDQFIAKNWVKRKVIFEPIDDQDVSDKSDDQH